MKKIHVLTTPFAILSIAALAVVLLESRRTPDWELALNAYIGQEVRATDTIHIEKVVTAGKPWAFEQEMGRAVPISYPWQIEQLPYPPTKMRCVLLKRVGTSAKLANSTSRGIADRHQILYIGYHSDTLWRVGWLVHEGPTAPFLVNYANDLDQVGCGDLATTIGVKPLATESEHRIHPPTAAPGI